MAHYSRLADYLKNPKILLIVKLVNTLFPANGCNETRLSLATFDIRKNY